MKAIMRKIEELMVAITFAEAGEYETALEFLGSEKTSDLELTAETVRTRS